MAGPDPGKHKREKVFKRSKTMIRKAAQLRNGTGADVYVRIEHELLDAVWSSDGQNSFLVMLNCFLKSPYD